MRLLKKLVFIPFFISAVLAVVVFGSLVIQDPLSTIAVFSFSQLMQMLYLSISLLLAAFFFCLIVALSNSWEIPLFASVLGALIPLMIISSGPANIILAAGFLLSFIVGQFFLLQKLRTYLTFQPGQILSPTAKLLVFVLTFVISLTVYWTVNAKIIDEGFSVPDSLIDTAIKLSGVSSKLTDPNLAGSTSNETVPLSLPQIDDKTAALIKNNPALLKQFNITPEQFDAYLKSQNQPPKTPSKASPTQTKPTIPDPANNLVQNLLKSQLDEAIKPYLSYIAPLMAMLIFATLISFNSLVGIILPLLLWLIFEILEKTNFVHFEKEMREVKKLVV